MDVVAALKKLSFVTVFASDFDSADVELAMTAATGRVRFDVDDSGVCAKLSLHGTLPAQEEAPARVRLRPQKGIAGALESLREIHVDDAVVDAAWVIHGSDAALLLALLPELRALAPFAPSIDIGDAVDVELTRVDDEAAVGAALALWHRAVFFRMGVS